MPATTTTVRNVTKLQSRPVTEETVPHIGSQCEMIWPMWAGLCPYFEPAGCEIGVVAFVVKGLPEVGFEPTRTSVHWNLSPTP